VNVRYLCSDPPIGYSATRTPHSYEEVVFMKKILALVFVIAAMLLIGTACQSASAQSADNASADTDAADSGLIAYTDESDDDSCCVTEPVEKYNSALALDLTAFSVTEASDIAHRISESPQAFEGTTIKVKGHYEYAANYNTGGVIHSVVVDNDTGCCPGVIELIWNGEHKFPEDYPEENAQIETEGVLKSYEEAGATYYYLDVDDITVL
jgi:hypothetical protein